MVITLRIMSSRNLCSHNSAESVCSEAKRKFAQIRACDWTRLGVPVGTLVLFSGDSNRRRGASPRSVWLWKGTVRGGYSTQAVEVLTSKCPLRYLRSGK